MENFDEENVDTRYQYSYVPLHYVVKNIDEYIIPECQPACRSFWDKNIPTFMCSNYDELGDKKYVLIDNGMLSGPNKRILERLVEKDPEHYYYSEYRDAYGICANGQGEEVGKELEELTEPFQMQDMRMGKMSREKFLMNVAGLVKYDYGAKSKYYEEIPGPKMEDYSDISEWIKAVDEYENKAPEIAKFDESLMEKTFEEYLQELGYEDLYDADGDFVYQDQFYKDAHQRYLDYAKEHGTEVRRAVADSYKEIVELGEYDVVEGNKPINFSDELKDIPEKMYNHMTGQGKGCCFVFSAGLINLMQKQGINCWMVGTTEGDGTRASVLYRDGNEFFVANPVEDIENKGVSIDGQEHDDSRIPLQEFANRYGTVKVIGNFSENGEYSEKQGRTLGEALKEYMGDSMVIATPQEQTISVADLSKLTMAEKINEQDVADVEKVMEVLNRCVER